MSQITKEEAKDQMISVLKEGTDAYKLARLGAIMLEYMNTQQDTPHLKGTPVFPKDFSPEEIMAERARLEKVCCDDSTRRRMGYYDLIADIADAYRNSGFVEAREVKVFPEGLKPTEVYRKTRKILKDYEGDHETLVQHLSLFLGEIAGSLFKAKPAQQNQFVVMEENVGLNNPNIYLTDIVNNSIITCWYPGGDKQFTEQRAKADAECAKRNEENKDNTNG